jgi:serine/threonine-protein kinase
VATSVAHELEVQLAGDEANKIELGGTRNPEAYDAYLRGSQMLSDWDGGEAGLRAVLAAFDEAIRLDPGFARPYSARASALGDMSIFVAKPGERAGFREQARQSAEKGVALAPELGEAHSTLAQVRAYDLLDFAGAAPEYERALALAPGSAKVQSAFGAFSGQLAHFAVAEKAARRAVSLDPQNWHAHQRLGAVLAWARRYDEALTAFQDAKVLAPQSKYINSWIANTFLALGQVEQALPLCEAASLVSEGARHQYLAIAYHTLGRQDDAESELQKLKVNSADGGDRDAFELAMIYAQWGRTDMALQWLSKAERLRDPGFQNLRVAWELDPIRNDPQFKAIEARMNLPP